MEARLGRFKAKDGNAKRELREAVSPFLVKKGGGWSKFQFNPNIDEEQWRAFERLLGDRVAGFLGDHFAEEEERGHGSKKRRMDADSFNGASGGAALYQPSAAEQVDLEQLLGVVPTEVDFRFQSSQDDVFKILKTQLSASAGTNAAPSSTSTHNPPMADKKGNKKGVGKKGKGSKKGAFDNAECRRVRATQILTRSGGPKSANQSRDDLHPSNPKKIAAEAIAVQTDLKRRHGGVDERRLVQRSREEPFSVPLAVEFMEKERILDIDVCVPGGMDLRFSVSLERTLQAEA